MRHRTFAQALLVALGWLAALPALAAGDSPIQSIEIVQEADAYKASVVMAAPVPASIAWAVLTDFDNMAGWVPNVKESKVVSRDQNVVMVEQHGVAKFGLASFPYTSIRKMELDPGKTVKSTQVKGSMRRMESVMTVVAKTDGTQLTYQLQLVPAGVAAAVISKDFLAHELTEQFTAIVGEMKRRAR